MATLQLSKFPKPIWYQEYTRFLENKKLKEEYRDVRKCVERMLTKRDICLMGIAGYLNNVAREIGIEGVVKSICCLDESFLKSTVVPTVLFKKGDLLLERFNILMRRDLEAGFPEMFWSEEQHGASLRGGGRFRKAAGDGFFAFSISHLMPAFVVLLVGTVLSSAVFVGELIVNCLWKRKGRVEFML